jgi:2-oxoglutarate dehydrogenase E2 component (dihydrolipoamide succinyltransferase)/2-oxoisovalerate dehydrogenase E2 component (dihydrolipoyl transacylase)
MPQLGESIAEGTVVKWLIPPGGRVEKDQPLVEVETDKVSLEIPSPASGVLTEILVKEGQLVPIGTVIARLDSEAPTEVVNRVGGVVVRPMPQGEGPEHYSPAVRQLAKEHGVDLALVKGTGAGGRVTRKDILDFVAKEQPSAVSHQPSAEEILPLTAMRRTIAERMVKSRQTAAHVVTFFEADFSGIASFREALRQDSGQALRQGSGQGHSLTYLPFVISAVARAIKDVPILNSSWSEEGISLKRDIHIGVAVALEEGLLVPVVKHADRKGLRQLAEEVADLAERARAKKLNPDEVQGGTFTITNHGGSGSLFSTPIIHQPQIAILGVGVVQKRAVVVHDAIAIRPMTYLSLSFDHRVIDGATADRFMGKVKQYLEQPGWEHYA